MVDFGSTNIVETFANTFYLITGSTRLIRNAKNLVLFGRINSMLDFQFELQCHLIDTLINMLDLL